MRQTFLIFILICIITITSSICAFAAKPTMQRKAGVDDAPAVIDDQAMKIFIDKIEIYGKIAKPQTVFIIPGSDPRVDGIRIERRFFSNIFRNVEKNVLKKQKVKTQRTQDHILW